MGTIGESQHSFSLENARSRRDFLKRAVAGAGALAFSGGLLAACGATAPAAAPTTAPAAAAPTSAPAAAAPTTAPAAAPTAAPAAAPTTAPVAAAPTAAPAAAAGTLTVWHYSSQADVKTVQDYTALFTKKYPSVNPKLEYVEFSEMPKRAIAAAAAKSGPDVFIYGGNEVNAMFKTGVFRSVDSYWQTYADKAQFPDGVLSKFSDKVYGIKGYVNLTGLWYNKTILDAVGVQPPKTFDELLSVLGQVAAKKFTPIALTGQPTDQGDWTAFPWLTAYGFTYKNPDQSAIEQAFNLINTCARQGYLPKESVQWGQAETFTRWAVGDVAFMENGNWNIGPASRQVGTKGPPQNNRLRSAGKDVGQAVGELGS